MMRQSPQVYKCMTTLTSPIPLPVFSPPTSGQIVLDKNAVHVWLLDINQFTPDHYTNTAQMMNSSEHERAQKFIRGKNEYIASRWLLRKVLARYTGLPPAALRFLRTDKGKPYLPDSDIHFSLSHSGHWALLAVGRIELIGVDIEAIRATRDLPGIAENYYHPDEFARLNQLEGSAQTDYFYRLWTLKEATLKAIGVGISAGLEKVSFDIDEHGINAQIATKLDQGAGEWRFHQWALEVHDYCALAGKSEHPLRVKWFDALASPAFP
jgi:4'-phosphopantetheinyl transferase